jgi:hypothetical protein
VTNGELTYQTQQGHHDDGGACSGLTSLPVVEVVSAGARHRAPRPSLLERCGLRRRRVPLIPAQRQPGIELVDARTRVVHRVSDDELVAVSRKGSCWALCGAFVLVASIADPGRSRCGAGSCFPVSVTR